MQKIILGSIIVISLLVPILAGRAPASAFALRRALWWTFAAVAFYAFAVMFVYPRFVS